MPFVESLEEFKQRNGGDFVETSNGWTLFADGASSDGRNHFQPPRNPRKMLQIRIGFYETKLKKAEANAHRLKGYILSQASYHRLGSGPPPHPQAFVDLEAAAEEIAALRDTLAPLLHEWHAPQREQIERAEDDRRARNERADEAVARVMAIDF